MEVYASVVIVAILVLALGLLARRIRTWKEQILHAVSIVESNNAIAHQTTRKELSQQLDSVKKDWGQTIDSFETGLAQLSQQLDSVKEDLGQTKDSFEAALAAIGSDVKELLSQAHLRGLVGRAQVPPPRFIPDRRPPSLKFDEAAVFLRSLDPGGFDADVGSSESARNYIETHLRRLARTLDITPEPVGTRRALELGAYMQITPALSCLLGYDEVRGGYLGPSGHQPIRKTASVGRKPIFTCDIDLFDAEKDSFPYPDDYFDVVLACELLEHLRIDPMHMLLESWRVLVPSGVLVLTTPNIASFTSVARTLIGEVNPQIYSHYPTDDADVPHVREYTPVEVHDLLISAGFTVEWLFTERGGGIPTADIWIGPLLDHLRFPTHLRGEQIYVVARKRLGGNVIHRPDFLYDQ